eukprot:augustus_masked-scaffold_29-processed-gene-0.56-mRNA-1 protein AED:0.34 eAED:0.34 QI:0/-1/0/1/-1/1/1/0/144
MECSLIIIKPHIVREGRLGIVLDTLLRRLQEENLRACYLEMKHFSMPSAESFFSLYKYVVREKLWYSWCEELASGASVAIVVEGPDAVNKVRRLSGPFDLELGRKVRQKTLRAQFGTDEVKNCVHSTDLQEEGVFECRFVFELM